MSNLFKKLIPLAIAGIVSSSAIAADGTINFTGEIIAASCAISGASGTSVGGATGAQTIDVSLGKVSSDSLRGTSSGTIVGGKGINLSLNCGGTAAGLKSVKLQFDPLSGSGLDAKQSTLLKTTGSAQGVGIGIYDTDNKLINLAANETISGSLVETGEAGKEQYTANLNLRAGYVANGDTVKAGVANGTLPFTLTYE
ncbi:Fimbrial protein precursor [Pseudomonas chlororaphis subsp. aurantiaca]|uniref:fimbrial protein n=1 Tax=Pseudomonas chlororaphis TaxID=587753 RepID=UPI000F552F8D|nr:fimbrial protein [Pseudomonas chlororaphis]AZD35973.1 Fimbrial protein precursor [Pseudomonas chlororaphis subsp. aurantiaca]AZD42310.1 Fimbrial protein precursor [Pseudomonas chlororaphis subsp. aurantiaca]AZD48509.1 Fimbrial protein precursor [Pseudomonas chlororaphis subsp. aurantiaca]QHC89748.1 fimbrial protein [Pseudomonas chlororaphis]